MTPAHQTQPPTSAASDQTGAALLCAHNVTISLDTPCVMAILNITPDSFSDAGELYHPNDALQAAHQAVADRADILDIGGESTRPGAQPVDATEQLRRVIPVIESIRSAGIKTPLGIDTTLEIVARQAIHAGANIINDVSGATHDHNMLALAANTGAAIILMHRYTTPDHDRYSTHYSNDEPDYTSQGGVVQAVKQFLNQRAQAALRAGIPRTRIVIDPGLGFGKSIEDNLTLIHQTHNLCEPGFPVLSGLSRKSFLSDSLNITDPKARADATLAASLKHLAAGASIFRVHDVPAHVQAFQSRATSGSPHPR